MPEPLYDEARAAELASQLMSEETPEATETPAPEAEAVEQSEPTDSPAGETTAPEETQEVEDFLPRADLESLLEGVEDESARERIITAYKSFQSGFTKRTQEVSELRRSFEGIDPQAARQAYDFVQNLSSDRDFAVQVHQELSAALQEAGLTPGQASQEATRQIERAASEYEDMGLDPENPLVQKLTELEQWKAEQERIAAERAVTEQREAMVREIERQDASLRRENPKYEEADWEAVYRLAASTQGDLYAAQEQYEAIKDRLATEYAITKARVPQGIQPTPTAAPHSEQPVEIKTIDQAHEIAKERFRQLMAAREQ